MRVTKVSECYLPIAVRSRYVRSDGAGGYQFKEMGPDPMDPPLREGTVTAEELPDRVRQAADAIHGRPYHDYTPWEWPELTAKIDAALASDSWSVRANRASSLSIEVTPERVEAGLTDENRHVRSVWVSRHGYTPTLNQVLRCLDDEIVDIRMSIMRREDVFDCVPKSQGLISIDDLTAFATQLGIEIASDYGVRDNLVHGVILSASGHRATLEHRTNAEGGHSYNIMLHEDFPRSSSSANPNALLLWLAGAQAIDEAKDALENELKADGLRPD